MRARDRPAGTSSWSAGSATAAWPAAYSTLDLFRILGGVRSAIGCASYQVAAIGNHGGWRIAPSWKIATSVVPAPISTSATRGRPVLGEHGWLMRSDSNTSLIDLEPAAPHALDDVLGALCRRSRCAP